MAKTYIDKKGYRRFVGSNRSVHRWVAEKTYGKIPDGHIVHHKDGNKLNNNPSNLKIMSMLQHANYHFTNTALRESTELFNRKWNSEKVKSFSIVRYRDSLTRLKFKRKLIEGQYNLKKTTRGKVDDNSFCYIHTFTPKTDYVKILFWITELVPKRFLFWNYTGKETKRYAVLLSNKYKKKLEIG